MRLQVIPFHLEKINVSESEDDASVYCPEEGHSNGENSDEDYTIDDLIKLKIINSGDVYHQKNSSAEDFYGKSASHLELPGSGNYFQKLIHIPPGHNLQHQINELKSRNTELASFDAAMKYPMNLVEERFKHLNLDGRQVKVIP